MKKKHAKRVIASSLALILIATLLLPSSQPLIKMAQDFFENIQVWVDFSRPDSIGSLDDVGVTDDTSENTEEVDEGDDIYEVILKNPEKYYDVENELEALGIEDATLVHYDATSHTYLVAEHQYVTVFGGSIGTYTDDAGKAQLIDNTLIETEQGYTNKANAYSVLFPNVYSPDKGILVNDGDYQIELIPIQGDYTHSVVKDNSILYNSVYAHTDIQYTLVGNTIKEDIILLQPVETVAYEYILKIPGLKAEISNNQIYLYPEESTKDDVVYILRAPYMEDAAGEVSFDIQMSLREENGQTILTVTPDAEWLTDDMRQYPVRIDPTISSMDEDNNITVVTAGAQEGSPGDSIGDNGYLYVGYDDGSHSHNKEPHLRCRLYIKIKLGENIIPENSVIENATFSISHYTSYSDGESKFALYTVGESWPRDGDAYVTWDNQPTSFTFVGVQNSALVPNTYIDYDVTEEVNNWLRGIVKNYGFMLMGYSENGEIEKDQICEVYNIEKAPAPKLTITWSSLDDPFLVEKDIDDTTINLRPLTEKTQDGQLTLDGVFVDGLAAIDAKIQYQLYANGKLIKTYNPVVAFNERIYPDSTQFQEKYPNIYPYLNTLSNWQSELIDGLDTDVLYQIKASASKIVDGELKTGVEVGSDTFLIYQVKDYDTLPRIAKHYGVSLDTVMKDNRVQDAMVMAGNTIIIRNPKTTEAYNPGELTDKDKMTIDAALLGRGENCEFGFEPINLNTGNFYMGQTDASLPDFNGEFVIGRTYNSLAADVNSMFGRGWSFVYDQSISMRVGGDVIYRRADGSAIYFTKQGDGTYTAPAGYVYELKKIDDGWQITEASKTVYTFNGYGLLVSVTDELGFVTTLIYDEEYNLSKITTPSGKEFHFAVDGDGHITKVILPNGKGVSYQYDDDDNLIAVTNPRGDVRTYQYDDKHQMVSWADENGNTVIVNVYDEEGRVVKQTDANGGVATLIYGDNTTTTVDNEGNRTIYKYDEHHRTTQIVYPDGSTCHKTYNADNRLATETTVKGTKSYTYDAFGNVVMEVREDGASVIYTYNQKNQLLSLVGYAGGIIRFEYNDAGDMISSIQPDGSKVTYVYDELHRVIAQTDGRGTTTYYNYEGANLVSYIDGEGHKRSFTYDAMNRPLTSTDPLGNTTSYTYDNNGNKTSETAPDGGRKTYQLDALGNVLTETDPMGNTTTYIYDKMYNIIKATDALGNSITYQYDKNGMEIQKTDAKGNTISYTRDSMGRVIKEESILAGITSYEYDMAGNLVKIVDADGNVTVSEYNAIGLVTKITDAQGGETRYSYDALGNKTLITYADGSQEKYEYDNLGRLIRETKELGEILVYTYDENNNVVSIVDNEGRSYGYVYDRNNRKTRETNPEGGIREYIYDAAGRILTSINEKGLSENYLYDEVGRIISITDALGNTTLNSYDKNGNLKSTTDANGGVTRYTYDAMGNITSVTNALGNILVMKYDQAGNLCQTIDSLQGITSYEYDALGNVIKMTDALGYEYFYTYDKKGNIITVEGPEGSKSTKKYNSLGQVVYEEDAEGLQITYTYNGVGYLLSQIDNAGNKVYYTYDAVGNVLTKTDQIGRVTTYSYDKYGRLLSVVEPDGSATAYEYDVMNRVIAVTDAEGTRTTFEYDAVGNQIKIAEADGAEYSYEYDALNHVVSVIDPLGYAESYTYDALGNVATYTDKNGVVISYTYDANNNLLSVTDGKGGVTVYEYDELNRLITETSPEGESVEYRYDAFGKMTKYKDATGAITQYVYDGLGNLVEEISPKGKSTKYSYDTHSNLLQETDPLGNATSYDYNLNNQVVSMVQANGGTYTYTYDTAGRLETITSPLGFVTTLFYDEVDNVIKETNSLGQETSYAYDKLHRMIQSTNAVGGITTFTYDIRDNLISETNAQGYTSIYAYDVLSRMVEEKNPLGQITKCTYDAIGNLESVLEANGATTQYVYDANNNVTDVIDPIGNVSTYAYDKSNRLTGTTDALSQTMTYAYDASGRVVAETDKAGKTTGYEYDLHSNVITTIGKMGLQTHYGYDDNDNLIIVEDSAGNTSHYQYDNMGWLTMYTSALGKVTAYTYDLEGNQTSRTDATGRAESYKYDVAGRLTSYISPGGNITRYDYNQLNQLVEKSYENALGESNGTSVLYGYDALGQRITMLDAIGEASYEYDALGRVISVTDSAGQKVTYVYDEVGNLSTLGYPDGTQVNYGYDLNKNLISVEDRNGDFTYYKYDALNRMVEIIRPNYLTTYVAYDALDHITSLKTVNTVTGRMISYYTYTYNDEGYVVSELVEEAIVSELFEGVFEEFLDSILEDVDWESNQELQLIWQKFFEILHIGCDHNDVDEDGKLDNCLWEQLTTTTEYAYEYDDNFQLTKCTEIGEYVGITTYEYWYDEDGNRTKYVKTYEGKPIECYTYQYNNSNQLVSRTNESLWIDNVTYYTYDGDGNRISEKTGLWETTYEYTAENRLSVVRQQGVVLMAALYDGDNNRLFTMDYTGICTAPEKPEGCDRDECPFHDEICHSEYFAADTATEAEAGLVLLPDNGMEEEEEETGSREDAMNSLVSLVSRKAKKYYTTTEYVNDNSNEQVLVELNSVGDITDAYIYGNNRIANDTGDGTLYYLYDRTGSVTKIASEWGRVQENYSYDPYGNLTYGIPDSVNFYGYNGESTNLWTGLQYLRARYYDMACGVFLSEDTYAGQASSPLTLNRYAYVCNNPVNFIDPSGHRATNQFSQAMKVDNGGGTSALANRKPNQQVSGDMVEISDLPTSAGAIAAINGQDERPNRVVTQEVEKVEQESKIGLSEVIEGFFKGIKDFADFWLMAHTVTEESNKMCFNNMVDLLSRGDNLIRVVGGTIIAGGLSFVNLPVGLAAFGIGWIVGAIEANNTAKTEEEYADIMIDSYFETVTAIGASYVTGDTISKMVAVKGLTAATTLTVESAIETLVEEITYSLKTGNISLISAFLNFFTNIGFNKIAEVPQKVLRSIGETLEKWGADVIKQVDDWWKPLKNGMEAAEDVVEGGLKGGSDVIQSKFNKLLNSDYYKTDFGYDCSEIAQDFYDAAGNKGTIYRIEGKNGFVNGYDYDDILEFEYHEVYSDGTYIYDPRYLNTPVLKDDYFRALREINPDGFDVFTKQ